MWGNVLANQSKHSGQFVRCDSISLPHSQFLRRDAHVHVPQWSHNMRLPANSRIPAGGWNGGDVLGIVSHV